MKRKQRILATLLTATLLTGCAATGGGVSLADDSGGEAAELEGKDGKNTKKVALEQKLEIARDRRSLAALEEQASEQRLANKILQAKSEVEMSSAKLTTFQEATRPQRLASATLDLRSATDRAQEAADELAQIEIMYKDQDLDDLTAEFVVSRGRRGAARAAARIEIQKTAFQALEQRELPQELQRLQVAVEKAKASLGEIERQGEIDRQGKAISSKEAANEIKRLEDELEALDDEVKS